MEACCGFHAVGPSVIGSTIWSNRVSRLQPVWVLGFTKFDLMISNDQVLRVILEW